MKEHRAYIHNKQTQSLGLANHWFEICHHIDLEGTKIVAKEFHYYKHWVREAIDNFKHPNSINKDRGLDVSGR